MLNKIIEVSLKNRLVIVLLLAVGLGLGIRAMLRTPVDAFPDTTPVQVQINTVAPALSPVSRTSARSRSSACPRWWPRSMTRPTSTTLVSSFSSGWGVSNSPTA